MLRLGVLSITALLATAMASPLAAPAQRRYDPQLYRMRISAPGIENLDNRYLSLDNNTVGVFDGGHASGALRYYTIETATKGKFELHTWPIGFVDHALGLVGPLGSGLLSFEDLVNPRRDPQTGQPVATSNGGQPAVFTEFTLGGGVDPSTGRAGNTLGFAAAEPNRWTAWPMTKGEWEIRWYDRSQFAIAVYMPIEIFFEPADVPANGGPPIKA